jgi:UTP--glucose-1-phosphate uridylyltransferase
MEVTKAVITAAGSQQRTLPLQMLIDRDSVEKSVLQILVEEVVKAGIQDICVVVHPGDETAYAEVAGPYASRLHFVPQAEALGYGDAIHCAREFTADDPFLHLVGDHLFVSHNERSCAEQLVTVATSQSCTVSAVQATRESLLPYYGTVSGRRLHGTLDVYQVETVIEKPTPTEAEQRLIVSGMRSGHYLCYFGLHVLLPSTMEELDRQLAAARTSGEPGAIARVTLSTALAQLTQREQYLAVEQHNSRYDLGVKYGLFNAQLALALQGLDRDEVLAQMVELLAQRDLVAGRTKSQ